jgi:hypothetical protein
MEAGMRIFRLSSLVALFLGVTSGACLFYVSQNVQRAEENLAALKSAKSYEEQTIRVLKAEWSYLNRPERLHSLSESYLELDAPMPGAVLLEARQLPVYVRPVVPQKKPDLIRLESASFNGSAPSLSSMRQKIPLPTQKPPRETQKDFHRLIDEISKREGGE